jgi:membrane-bound lytic murein transglycosylase D
MISRETFACYFLFILSFAAFTQKNTNSDTLNPVPFINTVTQSLQLFYKDYINSKNYDSILKSLNYEEQTIPEFSDDVYFKRIQELNNRSPFGFDYNPTTLNSIKTFAQNRRSFIKIVLGRSSLYFDLFEEKLAEYGLPLELKYLACIESGLRPQIKSSAGALGLWQFMYRTGLYYGLEENNYIDERMDPIKSTDAACRCLKKLFGIYGDWNLALAAYNAGPGTVNKAIQRSGNKRNYWEIRPFLPSETQGYVPTFIAVTYLMTYHAEHNIVPAQAKLHNAQLDTMCLKRGISMKTISETLNWELQEIKELNPIYKTEFIPASEKKRCVTGPIDKILLLVQLDDSLSKNGVNDFDNFSQRNQLNSNDSIVGTTIYHRVESQETINFLAEKYKVTKDQIIEWNSLQSETLYEGQRLVFKTIKTAKPAVVEKPVPKPTPKTKKYHTVKTGETMSKIAAKYHLSLAQLKKLNPGKGNIIQAGDKIRIK